jgi:copper transport protein
MSLRASAFVLALLAALLQTGAACAHASLVRAEPADGALVAEPPAAIRLTFNEPVTPLVMRLIAPDGIVTTQAASAENATVTVKPPALGRGTHVLSWRVISADGHPVGGSLVFSVGEASGQPVPDGQPAGEPLVRTSLWAAKIVIYLALIIGIGGAFARTWLSEPGSAGPERSLFVLVGAGLMATPLSVGLQGLDALGLPLPALTQKLVWQAGFETSYGLTAIAILVALLAAVFALAAMSRAPPQVARGLSLVAVVGAGLALALSGHASNAAPQLLSRPAVFIHLVCVTFWIGALVPMIAAVKSGERGCLAHFSRAIPLPLAALIASGGALAFVQLDRIDALWTTNYGLILSGKLAAVVVLLALAACNRYLFTPRYRRGDMAGAAALSRTMRVELSIAVAILALVASWRFTPPPRALAATEPIELHLHGARAMAQVSLTPVRGRDPRVDVQVLDGTFNLFPVKEVTVTIANPVAGIEPVRRAAALGQNGQWRVHGLRIPIAGPWVVRVELLVDDFDKLVLEDQVDLPRLP